MLKTLLVPLLNILSVMASVTAQEWTIYTKADGLVENSIFSIREDGKGYLWFVSAFDGLSRFDGVRFTNLDTSNGLQSNNIYFTFADQDGHVWFATDRGLSRYSGKKFITLNATDSAGTEFAFILQDPKKRYRFEIERGIDGYEVAASGDSYPVDEVDLGTVNFILQDPDSTFWFATLEGLVRYDGKTFQNISKDGNSLLIRTIVEDQRGDLWFGGESGIYRKQFGKTGLEGPLATADISSAVEDIQGNLWFASEPYGVVKYDPGTGQFTRPEGLSNEYINVISADDHGNTWFGTDMGITRHVDGNFEALTDIDERQLNSVRSIWQDRDDNVWFGSENGVLKYRKRNLRHFTTEDGLRDNNVKTIMEDNRGTLWFGTEKGMVRYDGKSFHEFKFDGKAEQKSILAILQDRDGTIWIGTTGALYKNAEPLDSRSELTAVSTIIEDRSGILWFSTSSGIIKYDRGKFQAFPIEDSRIAFLDSRDRLWIGTWNSGVYLYDGGDELKHYSMSDGLGSNHIEWILESNNGDLWFGLRSSIMPQAGEKKARGGLCHFDGKRFRNFTREDGLISQVINVATEDSLGYLWLGTDSGVMKCDSLGAVRKVITEAHGLLSNYVASILLDRNGNLWFGTDKGVSKYDGHNFQNILLRDEFGLGSIENIFEDSNNAIWLTDGRNGVIRYTPPAGEIHPRILVTQIEADKIYDDEFGNLTVPSNRRISFAYKAISFKTSPKLMRFQHMLEGSDPGWRPSTYETRVHYENLEAGEYTFKVRAIDEDLHYSSPPASVEISVFQPFYLNPWYRSLMVLAGILAIAGAGYLILQIRHHRRMTALFQEKLGLQKEAERIQTAKMQSLSQLVAGVAHEINNPIGAISGSNDIISRALIKIRDNIHKDTGGDALPKSLAILEKTNAASKTASDRIARIVANLRAFVRLDEAEWQTASINDGLESGISLLQTGLTKKITFDTDFADIPATYCSPSGLNQAFMAILKNAADAIADEGTIRVKTEMRGDDIRVEITDDGTGIPEDNIDRIFDPGFTTKGVKVGVGLGLSICYKIIVDEHEGHIDVHSEMARGTTFVVTLPIRQAPKSSE